MAESFRDLVAWQNAMALVTETRSLRAAYPASCELRAEIEEKARETGRMIHGLIRSLRAAYPES